MHKISILPKVKIIEELEQNITSSKIVIVIVIFLIETLLYIQFL